MVEMTSQAELHGEHIADTLLRQRQNMDTIDPYEPTSDLYSPRGLKRSEKLQSVLHRMNFSEAQDHFEERNDTSYDRSLLIGGYPTREPEDNNLDIEGRDDFPNTEGRDVPSYDDHNPSPGGLRQSRPRGTGQWSMNNQDEMSEISKEELIRLRIQATVRNQIYSNSPKRAPTEEKTSQSGWSSDIHRSPFKPAANKYVGNFNENADLKLSDVDSNESEEEVAPTGGTKYLYSNDTIETDLEALFKASRNRAALTQPVVRAAGNVADKVHPIRPSVSVEDASNNTGGSESESTSGESEEASSSDVSTITEDISRRHAAYKAGILKKELRRQAAGAGGRAKTQNTPLADRASDLVSNLVQQLSLDQSFGGGMNGNDLQYTALSTNPAFMKQRARPRGKGFRSSKKMWRPVNRKSIRPVDHRMRYRGSEADAFINRSEDGCGELLSFLPDTSRNNNMAQAVNDALLYPLTEMSEEDFDESLMPGLNADRVRNSSNAGATCGETLFSGACGKNKFVSLNEALDALDGTSHEVWDGLSHQPTLATTVVSAAESVNTTDVEASHNPKAKSLLRNAVSGSECELSMSYSDEDEKSASRYSKSGTLETIAEVGDSRLPQAPSSVEQSNATTLVDQEKKKQANWFSLWQNSEKNEGPNSQKTGSGETTALQSDTKTDVGYGIETGYVEIQKGRKAVPGTSIVDPTKKKVISNLVKKYEQACMKDKKSIQLVDNGDIQRQGTPTEYVEHDDESSKDAEEKRAIIARKCKRTVDKISHQQELVSKIKEFQERRTQRQNLQSYAQVVDTIKHAQSPNPKGESDSSNQHASDTRKQDKSQVLQQKLPEIIPRESIKVTGKKVAQSYLQALNRNQASQPNDSIHSDKQKTPGSSHEKQNASSPSSNKSASVAFAAQPEGNDQNLATALSTSTADPTSTGAVKVYRELKAKISGSHIKSQASTRDSSRENNPLSSQEKTGLQTQLSQAITASQNLKWIETDESDKNVDHLVSRIDRVVHNLLRSGKLDPNAPDRKMESGLDQRHLQRNTAELLANLAVLRARRTTKEKSKSIARPNENLPPVKSPSMGYSTDKNSPLKEVVDDAAKKRQLKGIPGAEFEDAMDMRSIHSSGRDSGFALLRHKRDLAARKIIKEAQKLSDIAKSRDAKDSRKRRKAAKGPPKPELSGSLTVTRAQRTRNGPRDYDSQRLTRSSSRSSHDRSVGNSPKFALLSSHGIANHGQELNYAMSSNMQEWEDNQLRSLPMILNSATNGTRTPPDLSDQSSIGTGTDSSGFESSGFESDFGSQDNDTERLERIENMIQELRERRHR